MYRWFITWARRANALPPTRKASFSDTRVSSLRHISAFLCSWTLNSTSALYRGRFNSKITNKKNRNAKYVALGSAWRHMVAQKDTVYSVGAGTRGQSALCPTPAASPHTGQLRCFAALRVSTKPCVWIWGLRINFSKESNSQIKRIDGPCL